MLILFVVFLYLFIDILIGLLAKNKTIGFWGGFLISFFFSPLVGLIVALAAGPKQRKRPEVINNYYTSHNHTEAPPETLATINKVQLIEKLANMRANGMLTEEEYNREKAKVLNS